MPQHLEKRTFPIDHIINWYLGNYLMSPNNALREEEDEWIENVYSVIGGLRTELKQRSMTSSMTHRQFLELVKAKGIHDRYYRYQKPEPTNCRLCRYLGIR